LCLTGDVDGIQMKALEMDEDGGDKGSMRRSFPPGLEISDPIGILGVIVQSLAIDILDSLTKGIFDSLTAVNLDPLVDGIGTSGSASD